MIHEESEHLSFRVSQLEDMIKGSMRIIYLFNLEHRMVKKMGHMEDMMGHMENMMGHMENTMVERIVNLIHNSEESIFNVDDASQGTKEDKDNAHVDKKSINKSSLQ